MKNVYGIFGAGGYGREVMPVARAQLHKNDEDLGSLCFVVDDEMRESDTINGLPVLSQTEFIKIAAEQKWLAISIADSQARASVRTRPELAGVRDWTVMADNCVVMDNTTIGPGSILSPFVTVTSNVTIGSSFHANLYSYIAHDCVIGDFVTFAPGVKCNGRVVIENHVYVGAGAIIRPGEANGKPLTIGEGAVIGMGSVVTKDVPPRVTVFGNPAKILSKLV